MLLVRIPPLPKTAGGSAVERSSRYQTSTQMRDHEGHDLGLVLAWLALASTALFLTAQEERLLVLT